MAKRRKYSSQFKARVVLELLKEEKSVSELAAEHGVHSTQLVRWRTEALEKLPQLFEKTNSLEKLKAEHTKQVEDLYSEIGRLTTQLSWLKKKAGVYLDEN